MSRSLLKGLAAGVALLYLAGFSITPVLAESESGGFVFGGGDSESGGELSEGWGSGNESGGAAEEWGVGNESGGVKWGQGNQSGGVRWGDNSSESGGPMDTGADSDSGGQAQWGNE